VLIAGETDGGDPGSALMNQGTEEEQMQDSGRGGILRAARRRCDWFAYGLYALSPDVGCLKFCEAG
jgi:hypothetical protein